MNENFEEIFEYVFRESYDRIDEILKNEKVAEALTEKNNSYYKQLVYLNPTIDVKIIKAYCFSMLYMLILMASYKKKGDNENNNEKNDEVD